MLPWVTGFCLVTQPAAYLRMFKYLMIFTGEKTQGYVTQLSYNQSLLAFDLAALRPLCL